MRSWSVSLGLVLVAATACRQPDAPRHAPASEAEPSNASAIHALRACVPTPVLVAQSECGLRAVSPTAPIACVDFHPAGSPDVDVLSILVVRGPYDFAKALGIPSMQMVLDAGTPAADAVIQTYRDFEGPRFHALADGRQLKLEARGLMLGGVVHWATLASPQATFTTVIVRQIPLHDSPLADADRSAVEAWDLPAMLTCLDGRFWPRP